MKYILFGGGQYYARGGANDFICHGVSVDDLCYYGRASNVEWWHVFCTESKCIVAKSDDLPFS